MKLSPDFLDLLRAFAAFEVRSMIVGGYAVARHGRPRATKDLGVWIEASPANAPRVLEALREFGAPLGGLQAEDLSRPGLGLQFGQPPLRVDILTRIDGVAFEDAWPRAIEDAIDGVPCRFISREDLLTNKRAARRPQDLADVAALERAQRRGG